MRRAMQQTVGNFFPFGMEEVSRQNMAMMERAMSLFTPFYQPPDGSEPRPAANTQEELAALRDEIDSLRRQLAEAQRLLLLPPAANAAAPLDGAPTEPPAEPAAAGKK